MITHEGKKLKQALFGAFHRFAVLDSDLTLTLPMKQVISGAFDTLSHCMETYMGQPFATNVSDEINEAIMRNVIKNIRAIIANPDDDFARGELMWDSAMAENGMLKLGKMTDFQCHMIEHAVGAYTDCNHGQGLAVIHPALYRHYLRKAHRNWHGWPVRYGASTTMTICVRQPQVSIFLKTLFRKLVCQPVGAGWVSLMKRCYAIQPIHVCLPPAAARNLPAMKSLKF